QAEDGIRDFHVTGVQTCALPISIISTRSGLHFIRYSEGIRSIRHPGALKAPCTAHSQGNYKWTSPNCWPSSSRTKPPTCTCPPRSEERRVGRERISLWVQEN